MFRKTVETWKTAALAAAVAKHEHELALGKALLEATAKNAEGRKAEAEAACVMTRKIADALEIERDAVYQVMIHLRGEPDNVREFQRPVLCGSCDGSGYVHGDGVDEGFYPATFGDELHEAAHPGIKPCTKCRRCEDCGQDGCDPGICWELDIPF